MKGTMKTSAFFFVLWAPVAHGAGNPFAPKSDSCKSCPFIPDEGQVCCGGFNKVGSNLSDMCPDIGDGKGPTPCCDCSEKDFDGCLCPQKPPPPMPEPVANKYPTATAHGMGDSCFNAGMKEITELIGKQTKNTAKCIPTGNRLSDTPNGFFMTMNKNVDVFADKIKQDKVFANGFNCVGFSQGNSICRGYIQKYNGVSGYPPVINFLSVHGTVSGVAGFPNCNPKGLLGPVCKQLAKLAGGGAELLQGELFQADYFRDPTRVGTDRYKKNVQIAQWNNEGETVDPSIKENFIKTKRFIMIKAAKDSMVYPNEGEHWGHFADGGFSKVLTMKETDWYQKDLFGLKTVDEAGKIRFNETAGDHLQFSIRDLAWWVTHDFTNGDDDFVVV